MGSKTQENTVVISTAKVETINMHLEGDEDLVLCGKARSYELPELWKQSHPKGSKMPENLSQPYCQWERLITSIHWLMPIELHDDDWSKYTEEEWKKYMTENAPCILAKAWTESFKESFLSCGFKEATGRTGADLRRTLSMTHRLTPISFAQAGFDPHLVPNNSVSHTNVLSCPTVLSGWSCDIGITYLPSVFPEETIIQMVQTAGKFIGIGSRRGDGYGRYHIDTVTRNK